MLELVTSCSLTCPVLNVPLTYVTRPARCDQSDTDAPSHSQALSLGTADEVGIPLGSAIDGYNAELINRVNAFKVANPGVSTHVGDL